MKCSQPTVSKDRDLLKGKKTACDSIKCKRIPTMRTNRVELIIRCTASSAVAAAPTAGWTSVPSHTSLTTP